MYTSEISSSCAPGSGCTFLRLLLQPVGRAAGGADGHGDRRVTLDAAVELAELAVGLGHARRGLDGQYVLGPDLQLALSRLGIRRLGELTLEQARAVRTLLTSRRGRPDPNALATAAETVRAAARPHDARSLRERGLSQAAAARVVGVHRSTIARWESGTC
jgi:hypothetical protein